MGAGAPGAYIKSVKLWVPATSSRWLRKVSTVVMKWPVPRRVVFSSPIDAISLVIVNVSP
jgi:hypothetical protein